MSSQPTSCAPSTVQRTIHGLGRPSFLRSWIERISPDLRQEDWKEINQAA
jgi:hypothetical protein